MDLRITKSMCAHICFHLQFTVINLIALGWASACLFVTHVNSMKVDQLGTGSPRPATQGPLEQLDG